MGTETEKVAPEIFDGHGLHVEALCLPLVVNLFSTLRNLNRAWTQRIFGCSCWLSSHHEKRQELPPDAALQTGAPESGAFEKHECHQTAWCRTGRTFQSWKRAAHCPSRMPNRLLFALAFENSSRERFSIAGRCWRQVLCVRTLSRAGSGSIH